MELRVFLPFCHCPGSSLSPTPLALLALLVLPTSVSLFPSKPMSCLPPDKSLSDQATGCCPALSYNLPWLRQHHSPKLFLQSMMVLPHPLFQSPTPIKHRPGPVLPLA
jgi:hypothetical protein